MRSTAPRPNTSAFLTPTRASIRSRKAPRLDPKPLITHRFKLDQILDAYETFGQAASTGALIIEA